MKQHPLANLRDIHMPEPVSWWPPAPGWWLLLGLVLLLVAVLFRWLKNRKTRQVAAKQFSQAEMIAQALSELDALQENDGDQQAVIADLSALLRRVAMRLHQDDTNIAGLSGYAWLIWLDGQWDKDAFSHGAGRQLLDAPFQPHVEVDIEALLQLARRWIEAQQ